ncbi:methyltransferase domain-containing protein [Alphaproteobacteria bacterium]|nr:methyltransferase domain-containing protein [Alphaproteobacteria bacterium]
MGIKKNIVTDLHESSKRDYLFRMNNNKAHCMKIAKKYEKDYWDGDRSYGYGGYKYIPGRWKYVAKRLISNYKLKSGSKILDIGCGKGFLLKEILLLQPGIEIYGIDVSKHAIKSCPKELSKSITLFDAKKKLPFKNNSFDLAFSLGTYHNFDLTELKLALYEINRVSKSSYIMVESYRNDIELTNLQCWALTCNSFFNPKEWVWLFKEFNYKGDYEFIFFK